MAKSKLNPLKLLDPPRSFHNEIPAPPNPSIAPSEKTDPLSTRGTTPTLLRTDDEYSIAETESIMSEMDDDDDSVDDDGPLTMGEDCAHSHDDGVMPSEIPRRVEDFMERFSALSLVDLGIFNSLQMMERAKELNILTNRYEVIDGLTTSETKRQFFHCYLKESGLLGAIAKGILALYAADEFPPYDQVGEFLANQMGYSMTIRDDIAEIKTFNSMLNSRIQRLEVQNDWLRRRLDDFMSTESPIEVLDPDTFDPNRNEEHKYPNPYQITKRPHRLKPRQLNVNANRNSNPPQTTKEQLELLLKPDDKEVLEQTIAQLDKEMEQRNLNTNKLENIEGDDPDEKIRRKSSLKGLKIPQEFYFSSPTLNPLNDEHGQDQEAQNVQEKKANENEQNNSSPKPILEARKSLVKNPNKEKFEYYF